jgi:hypothetical protein
VAPGRVGSHLASARGEEAVLHLSEKQSRWIPGRAVSDTLNPDSARLNQHQSIAMPNQPQPELEGVN